MATLNDLLAQKAALEKQIMEAQREERGSAIGQVRALMSQYGLTLADLGNRGPAGPGRRAGNGGATGSKVAAKYRNPETGDTWSGRGLQPKWLKAAVGEGRALTDFAI